MGFLDDKNKKCLNLVEVTYLKFLEKQFLYTYASY